jgi:hypothetical protein
MEGWRNNCYYVYGNVRGKENTFYKLMEKCGSKLN